ncbi:uncharacterized protein LOC112458116 [Temnothorax curvispinosus]|uniref:Uncharacterized protein LOC112458116 n=1 Tax=Temnothorax curvispinosus TaxID=300111 RepID=A0A6J1Q7D9_9HYME|nr:uncharacterized protein LOC112458116 [Temnothorax curvispinosus]
MGHSLMATCVLVAALVLPRLIHGRPATNDGSVLSMLESRVSKPENFSEPKAISPLMVQENLSIPAKSRQRRLSDQRRAELEALVTLSKINSKRSLTTRRSGLLDPMIIGRRRRFAMDQAPTELVSIKAKYTGDPAYSRIS